MTGDQTNRNSIIKRSGTCGIFPFTCTRRHVIVPQSMTAVEATERLLKGREFVRKRQHLKSTTPWKSSPALSKTNQVLFCNKPLFVFSLSPDWLNLYSQNSRVLFYTGKLKLCQTTVCFICNLDLILPLIILSVDFVQSGGSCEQLHNTISLILTQVL